MKLRYRAERAKREAAKEFLSEIEVMEKCRELVESTVVDAGRIVVMSLLESSAALLTGVKHQGKRASPYVRHGSQQGSVYVGGEKVQLDRPRVRTVGGKEAKIPAYETLRDDEQAQAKVHRAVLAGVSSRNYKKAIEDSFDAIGVSKSSVSRKFIEKSERDLKELLERRIPREILAILIDGIHIGPYCLITAVGIDSSGQKHVLGLGEGTTENSAVVKDLLSSSIERGLDIDAAMLFVLDGSKALSKAVREVCGSHHFLQRCRVHKLRNVLDRLPESKKAYYRSAIRAAWKLSSAEGMSRMREIARELSVLHADAGNSLLEGLVDTFTVNKLELSPLLVRSLSSTNLVENPHGAIRVALSRVKRFDSSHHAMRWTASALLDAEKSFRTLKGYKELWMLSASLGRNLQEKAV